LVDYKWLQLYVQAINWQALENKAINRAVICAGINFDNSVRCHQLADRLDET